MVSRRSGSSAARYSSAVFAFLICMSGWGKPAGFALGRSGRGALRAAPAVVRQLQRAVWRERSPPRPLLVDEGEDCSVLRFADIRTLKAGRLLRKRELNRPDEIGEGRDLPRDDQPREIAGGDLREDGLA